MPSCDVIIPTYNNADSIPRVLKALSGQVLPAGWCARLILSDDGSSDATVALAAKDRLPAPWHAPALLAGEHGGAAAARNRALDISSADIIFFLGADIILQPGALYQHLAWHAAHVAPHEAVLGMVVWDPCVLPTPLMQWMMHGGPQNDFDSLLGTPLADSRHFFTASHLSLKRSFLGAHRFDTSFRQYGWEDLDLGRRLHRQGLTLAVLPDCLGWHHHGYTAATIKKRQYAVGKGLVLYQNKYPREQLLPPRPQGWKAVGVGSPLVSRIVWQLVSLLESRWTWPWLFQKAASLEFWRGVEEADIPKMQKKSGN